MTNSINWDKCERMYFDVPYLRTEVLDNLVHYELVSLLIVAIISSWISYIMK